MSKPRSVDAVLSSAGIRLKLTAIIALGTVSIFVAIFFLTVENQRKTLREVQYEKARLVSSMLAGEIAGSTQFRDSDRVGTFLDKVLGEDLSILAIDVVHASGDILTERGIAERRAGALDNLMQDSRADPAARDTPSIRFEDDYLITTTPIRTSGSAQPVGVLYLAWDSASYEKTMLTRIKETLLKGVLVAILGLVTIVWVIGRIVTGPIQSLTKKMERIGARDFEAEIPFETRADEIGQMARSLAKFRDALANEEQQAIVHEHKAARRQAMFHRLADGLSDLAEGILDRPIDLAEFDGMGQDHVAVCSNYNVVLENMQKILSTISSAAESVRASSAEIADVTVDQSKRSETQAVTLEESAAAIEMLSASVDQTAENAAEANDRIILNRNQAQAGGKVVNQTIEAMKNIEKSSDQIREIIGVIDDIAFQTNLLALNAGVEAARAGEAGRGFAVVASEVRALAQRASESANEIKELILRSGEQVTNGSALVNKTGAALSDIITGVNHASELVSSIATGSREQANSLAEVTDSVSELDRVTQQNAAVIEEASAASSSLKEEAIRLTDVIKTFKLAGFESEKAIQEWDADQRRDEIDPPTGLEAEAQIAFSSKAKPAQLRVNQSDEWHDF